MYLIFDAKDNVLLDTACTLSSSCSLICASCSPNSNPVHRSGTPISGSWIFLQRSIPGSWILFIAPELLFPDPEVLFIDLELLFPDPDFFLQRSGTPIPGFWILFTALELLFPDPEFCSQLWNYYSRIPIFLCSQNQNTYSRILNFCSLIWNSYSRIWNSWSLILYSYSRIWNSFSLIWYSNSRIWNFCCSSLRFVVLLHICTVCHSLFSLPLAAIGMCSYCGTSWTALFLFWKKTTTKKTVFDVYIYGK